MCLRQLHSHHISGSFAFFLPTVDNYQAALDCYLFSWVENSLTIIGFWLVLQSSYRPLIGRSTLVLNPHHAITPQLPAQGQECSPRTPRARHLPWLGIDHCNSGKRRPQRQPNKILLRTGKRPSSIDFSRTDSPQCWFCIPVLIYQAAIPTFQRTKRFANPYAFAILDVLFTILWFAAFIGVAVYTNTGISNGEAKDKDHKLKGCAAFDGGTESKCKLSQATIGMGVVVL